MTTDGNPRAIKAVERAILESNQRRALERALMEAAPADKTMIDDRRYTDPIRMRNIPVTTLGVAAVQPGTQPLQALLTKEAREGGKIKE